jgi:2-amino-4-hydroxy-6-hydroxymethyldihydropteridine diphosphokinase
MAFVYLGLGTNLGDRMNNLLQAVQALPLEITLRRASQVYETKPEGYLTQPDFLNQVLETETTLPPMDLLISLKQLENQLGRQKTFKDGPRLIDIDILFYDNKVIELPGLIIPHPRLAGRAFVLAPLVELAPDFYHPVIGKTIRELLESVSRIGVTLYQE